MTKRQALIYKQRWDRIGKIQNLELRTLSMSLKFKQLCFLMNSFRLAPTIDQARKKEINQIRQRWLMLKKQRDHGY